MATSVGNKFQHIFFKPIRLSQCGQFTTLRDSVPKVVLRRRSCTLLSMSEDTFTNRIDNMSSKKTYSVTVGRRLSPRIMTVSQTTFNRVKLFSTSCRRLCDDSKRSSYDSGSMPKLMDFRNILYPSFFLTLKNFVLSKFIVEPYFDKDFDITGFTNGARQALIYVSEILSEGRLDDLNGLVSPEACKEINRNYSLYSEEQKENLKLSDKDIFLIFPYQIGIMFPDREPRERYVEITMVCHCLRGWKDSTHYQTLDPALEKSKNIIIWNFRLWKEFTKGRESNWIINKLNVFSAQV